MYPFPTHAVYFEPKEKGKKVMSDEQSEVKAVTSEDKPVSGEQSAISYGQEEITRRQNSPESGGNAGGYPRGIWY